MMATRKSPKKSKSSSARAEVLLARAPEPKAPLQDSRTHVFGNAVVCDTDDRGYRTPGNRNPLELQLDASEGFIPLWANDMTLRWRFQERSLNFFHSPATVKSAVRQLLGEALLAWGDAAPIRFSQQEDAWDFEIVVRDGDRCSTNGCVLASAFFPDPGRHELVIYPRLFEQTREEQIETLIHELGHVFGLRHFFAKLHESEWASESFGTESRFTIMNYGPDSKLTAADRSDLKRLYRQAWSGELTHINGTPIQLVRPYNTLRPQMRIAMVGGAGRSCAQPCTCRPEAN